MALKCLCHGTKYPLKTPLFGLLIIGVPWHKKGFSDLVPGTHIEGLGETLEELESSLDLNDSENMSDYS
jgi:hypothetical protein